MKTKITLLIIMGLFLAGFIHNSAVAQDDLVDSFKENLPQLLNSNNAGTLFWITFHPCWEMAVPITHFRIYVSSAVATTVTLEIPGLAIMRQKVTIPNDVIEFILSPVTEGQAYTKTDRCQPLNLLRYLRVEQSRLVQTIRLLFMVLLVSNILQTVI
jgi:hypothetical protein